MTRNSLNHARKHRWWNCAQILIVQEEASGEWVTGSPQSEASISVADAIAIAGKHGDELLAGTVLLERLPEEADDSRYLQLQLSLAEKAPTIADLAWAHKYLSLLFSDKLDDYHNHKWQRLHLVRLLETPPPQQGLYVLPVDSRRFHGSLTGR